MHTYQGSGAVRSLGPGAHFTLTEHADFVADYDYLVQSLALNQDRRQNANDQAPELIVLAITHSGANNLTLGGQESATGAAGEPGSYRNSFTAVRPDAPIVPHRQPRPAALLQTALVTGLADSLAACSSLTLRL